jgi:hypothetical protein
VKVLLDIDQVVGASATQIISISRQTFGAPISN